MHPADIKAAIEKAGSSQRDIAHECQVTPSTVAHVIHGRGISAKVAQVVATVTGHDLNTLWPGKYDKPAKDVARAEEPARHPFTSEQVAA